MRVLQLHFFCAVVKFPSSYCVQWNDIKHCFGKLWWASAKQLISVRSCELVPVRVLGVRGVCCVYSCCSTHSQWRTSHHDLKAGGAPSFLAEMCSCVKIIILLGFFQYKHWLRLLVLGCFGLGCFHLVCCGSNKLWCVWIFGSVCLGWCGSGQLTSVSHKTAGPGPTVLGF